MISVDDLTQAVIWVIRAGVMLRIAFCFIKLMGNDNESAMYKKRAIYAGVFYIIAESVWQLKDIVFYYYLD